MRSPRNDRLRRLSLGLLLGGVLLAPGGLCAATAPAPPAPPLRIDFEDIAPENMPADWALTVDSYAAHYRAAVEAGAGEDGSRGLRLLAPASVTSASGFGSVAHALDAGPYRGKRVRLRVAVRVDGEIPGARARLWLAFEHSSDDPSELGDLRSDSVLAPGWEAASLTGDVPRDADRLRLGLVLIGGGAAWFDNVTLEVLGEAGAGNEPARLLTPRGLENLTAFTRLLGYVRYFHPSDEAAAADWPAVALAGVQRVEGASDPADLAKRLGQVFQPLAPTLRFVVTGSKAQRQPVAKTTDPAAWIAKPGAAGTWISWLHHGVGIEPGNLYTSRRVTRSVSPDVTAGATGADAPTAAASSDRAPRPALVADLGGGVSIEMPVELPTDEQGTLPHVAHSDPPAEAASGLALAKPATFAPNGDDRTTRLADVALAWNVFQHFYPYFDVVPVDWAAELRRALTTAASDRDAGAFLATLRRMVAALQDGHGYVTGPVAEGSWVPPLLWEWIEDGLVVTTVREGAPPALQRGDVVLSLNGRTTAQVVAEREAITSAATPQFRRWTSLQNLLFGAKDSALALQVRHLDARVERVDLERSKRIDSPADLVEPRPDKIAELRPGILYVDLSRVHNEDLTGAMDKLAAAKGLIFDVRGYPAVSTDLLRHLIDDKVTSAQWNVPRVTRPDHLGMEWDSSNWSLTPAKLRFQGKAAFLTDGRAISYAETYLGIVAHYKLAAIVGGPTAGTNGNVNPFSLPGGYRVSWTGMQVLEQDGSRHHGVGIQPTIPVARTVHGVAEGKDEVLERAIVAVSP